MKIIAADDEIIALEVLVDAIKEAEPNAEVISFRNGRDVLDYIAENSCDVCFFDIEMRDINGIELAYEAKKFNPKINILNIHTTICRKQQGNLFLKDIIVCPYATTFINLVILVIH